MCNRRLWLWQGDDGRDSGEEGGDTAQRTGSVAKIEKNIMEESTLELSSAGGTSDTDTQGVHSGAVGWSVGRCRLLFFSSWGVAPCLQLVRRGEGNNR